MQVDSRRMEVGGCWMRLGYDRLSNSNAGSKVADSIIDVAGAVSADSVPCDTSPSPCRGLLCSLLVGPSGVRSRPPQIR